MTSEAKIAANRRNAARSTGPRTEEGKATVSQNAVKHGLWSHRPVLKDEDPAEFELFRSGMLQDLAAVGGHEQALAERIVAAWWRLKRAECMQDEALDYLIEADRADDWYKRLRAGGDPSAAEELRFGRVVARDFANARTIEKLSIVEQRIEGGLYKSVNQLRRMQKERKEQEEVLSGNCELSSSDGATPPVSDRQAALAAATPIVGVDSVKQSQSVAMEGGQCRTPETATQTGMGSDSAEQSQSVAPLPGQPVETQYLASLDPIAVNDHCSAKQSQPGMVEGGHGSSCETAKQSQSVATLPGQPVETQYLASLDPIAVNDHCPAKQSQPGTVENGHGSSCETAKQSQSAKPAGGGVMLRPRAQYPYHYHDTIRRY